MKKKFRGRDIFVILTQIKLFARTALKSSLEPCTFHF